MRACIAAVALVAMMLALASSVSAGSNGKWGKGLLSEQVEFEPTSDPALSGDMNYCPDSGEFIFDFHAQGFTNDVKYSLICYNDDSEIPFLLGYGRICSSPECPDEDGIHIRDTLASWPGIIDATICLVDNKDNVYLTSIGTFDLSGPS